MATEPSAIETGRNNGIVANALELPGVEFVEPIASEADEALAAAHPMHQLGKQVAALPHAQTLLLSCRQWKLMGRDWYLLLLLIGQPVLLGSLICLTQFAASRLVLLLFFSIVLSIWLGLNNSARDIVRERRQYLREHLAGLDPLAYLAAKLMVHGSIGLVQIGFLLLILFQIGPVLIGAEARRDELASLSLLWVFGILFGCYLSGLGLGLLISSLANSEEGAVALVPLLIMPQLLISAVSAGLVEEVFSRPIAGQPIAFRPLLAKLPGMDAKPQPGEVPSSFRQGYVAAGLLDAASLLCISRPAVLLSVQSAETGIPAMPDHVSRFFWLLDLFHFAVLLALTWMATVVGFLWAERRWLPLIGIS